MNSTDRPVSAGDVKVRAQKVLTNPLQLKSQISSEDRLSGRKVGSVLLKC